MENISVGGEVGGAGGAYSYEALKRLDNVWSSICSIDQTGTIPDILILANVIIFKMFVCFYS